jgi:hypothetical protein
LNDCNVFFLIIFREEFENWAAGILAEYPDYEVKLSGVGYPPSGPTPEGPCSQVPVKYA